MKRPWIVPMVLTVLVATTLVTLGSLRDRGGYVCRRSPISMVLDPEPETGGEHFFDEGAACNAEARGRMIAAGVVLAIGSLVTVGVARGRPVNRPTDRPTDDVDAERGSGADLE